MCSCNIACSYFAHHLQLEEALQHFDGAVLVVSHDRYFVSQVANTICTLEDKQLKRYEGDYRYYMEQNEQLLDKVCADHDMHMRVCRCVRSRRLRCVCVQYSQLQHTHSETAAKARHVHGMHVHHTLWALRECRQLTAAHCRMQL